MRLVDAGLAQQAMQKMPCTRGSAQEQWLLLHYLNCSNDQGEQGHRTTLFRF
jgi:hypothetical protein